MGSSKQSTTRFSFSWLDWNHVGYLVVFARTLTWTVSCLLYTLSLPFPLSYAPGSVLLHTMQRFCKCSPTRQEWWKTEGMKYIVLLLVILTIAVLAIGIMQAMKPGSRPVYDDEQNTSKKDS